jgi:hypothetical protein
MIFINDCSSGCGKILTQGFDDDQFVYLDIVPFLTRANFDLECFIDAEILPLLND